MAKLTAPVLSLAAKKTIGKSITFFRSRGMDVARQRVIPYNPQSPDQTTQRGDFKQTNATARIVCLAMAALWKTAASAAGKGETWLSRAIRAGLMNDYLANGANVTTTLTLAIFTARTGAERTTTLAPAVVTVQQSTDGVTWGAPITATFDTDHYEATIVAQAGYAKILLDGELIGFCATTT